MQIDKCRLDFVKAVDKYLFEFGKISMDKM